MISTNKNILLIDNKDSFTYNLVQLFEDLGCFVEVSDEFDLDRLVLNKFERIVFSPGPGLPVDFPIMTEILKNVDEQTRILGICLGHQAIAQFFGATLFKQVTVQHGQRKRIINLCKNSKSAMFNMPGVFEAGLYHSWAVEKHSLPDFLSVSCISEDGVIMGISHNVLPIEGLQFHPESFLTELGSSLIKNWLAI